MNKALRFFAWLGLLSVGARAENTLMEGGRSPDGRYEVRIARTNSEPSDYAIHIYAAEQNKSIYELENTGGYLRYDTALERCRAWWHASGEFVALTDQGTRHSKEVYILAVSADSVNRLPIPDFVQNALGRVKATEIDIHCVSTPVRWERDNLLLTHYFSVTTPKQGRLFYACEVILHLTHGPDFAPAIGLNHVSTPKPGNG